MTARPFVALLVSPDRTLLRRLTRFLQVFGYDVRQATDPTQAATVAEASVVDFLIVDGKCDSRQLAQLCRNVRRLSSEGYVYAMLVADDRELRTLTDAMESGYDDFLIQPVVYGELLARMRAGSRVIEFERRLNEQAGVDSQTGLADPLALQLKLQAELQSSDPGETAVALIDVDSFRRIVRRFGENASTSLHVEIAKLLQKEARPDEFLAVIHANRFSLAFQTPSMEEACDRVRELTQAIAAYQFEGVSDKLLLTASAGITLLRSKERPEQAIERAERALELAKSSGRNTLATSDDVDDEVEAWAESAAAGRLFETTLARDVMIPCPLVLPAEESLDAAHGLLAQTQLTMAPVVDADGKLLGIALSDELESRRPRSGKVRSSSIRLVRHVMSTDVPTFEETASLGTLMEFFTADGRELAVIVRDKRPLGVVTCQGLAALNERLTVDRFVPCGVASAGSEYLVVPDVAKPEAD